MKKETWLPGEIYKNRKLVFSLAKNDFKTKYAGSYFGTVWAFVQPIVTICVYWFVFGLALRNGSDKGVPFVLWLDRKSTRLNSSHSSRSRMPSSA